MDGFSIFLFPIYPGINPDRVSNPVRVRVIFLLPVSNKDLFPTVFTVKPNYNSPQINHLFQIFKERFNFASILVYKACHSRGESLNLYGLLYFGEQYLAKLLISCFTLTTKYFYLPKLFERNLH
jgi:hypothetical protein